MSTTTCYAAIHDSNIPMSEYMKKEFFYKCFTKFSQAIGAEPSLIADEVRKHCTKYDYYFGSIYYKSRAEREQDMRFTQGDYRRFCMLFYLFTKKLIQTAEILVLREGKKRIMPRQLVNAAISTGIIPYKIYASQTESPMDKQFFDLMR